MIVTINTDASFSFKYKRGAYAFWIVSNEFRIKTSGMLRRKVSRPEIAEFRCIVNALEALSRQDRTFVSKVIINTDCLNVLHVLRNDKAAIGTYGLNRADLNHLKDLFFQLFNKNFKGAELDLRHVKAHETTGTAVTWVNDWCDQKAKEALRLELKLQPLK